MSQAPAPAPLRLLLVDDHAMVRAGLHALLSRLAPDIEVLDAATVAEGISEADRLHPDVVLMDVRLGGGSGIAATREIRSRRPATKVVMFTSFADDDAFAGSVLAGASGFVLKQVLGGDIVRTVRDVAAGKNLLDPETTRLVFDRLRQADRRAGADERAFLTAGEEAVIALVAVGKTNREIGEDLGVAEKTVRNFLSTILAKLEVRRSAQATGHAVPRFPISLR